MYHNKANQTQRQSQTGQRENHHEDCRTLPILPGIKDAERQEVALDISPELLSKLRSYA